MDLPVDLVFEDMARGEQARPADAELWTRLSVRLEVGAGELIGMKKKTFFPTCTALIKSNS